MRRTFASSVAPHAVVALASLPPLIACAAGTRHYEDVVRIAASKHPRACTTPYTVTPLGSWSYRVDACEGTLYYRCHAQQKSMGHTQCCTLVPDEAAATALLAASNTTGERSTCVEFAD
jgi:hypothetical protein